MTPFTRLSRLAGVGLGLTIGLFASGCGTPATGPEGPTASFTWEPVCELTRAATLTSTSEPGAVKLVQWQWAFGAYGTEYGPIVTMRWPDALNGTEDVNLTVTDANGQGDYHYQVLDLTTCLTPSNGGVDINGTTATPHISMTNNSGYDDALVAFNLDVLDQQGLPLALNLTAGQFVIPKGKTVQIGAVMPVACGSDCPAFAAGTVVAHVITTYWCKGTCR